VLQQYLISHKTMAKITLNPSREQIKSFMTDLPDDQPIVMVNLLKFKDKVEGTNLTGEEAYQEYADHFIPIANRLGAKVLWMGKPLMYVIGSEEDIEWDKMLLVEYPSKHQFYEMVKSPDYNADLRTRAIENSKLIPATSTYSILNP